MATFLNGFICQDTFYFSQFGFSGTEIETFFMTRLFSRSTLKSSIVLFNDLFSLLTDGTEALLNFIGFQVLVKHPSAYKFFG